MWSFSCVCVCVREWPHARVFCFARVGGCRFTGWAHLWSQAVVDAEVRSSKSSPVCGFHLWSPSSAAPQTKTQHRCPSRALSTPPPQPPLSVVFIVCVKNAWNDIRCVYYLFFHTIADFMLAHSSRHKSRSGNGFSFYCGLFWGQRHEWNFWIIALENFLLTLSS